MLKAWAAASLLALVLAGCEVKVSSSDGKKYEGAGVTFVVPMETSSVQNGPTGIKYEGKSVKAVTDGKTLTVNGKNFGQLQTGDVVDLTAPGVVKVDGVERQPTGT